MQITASLVKELRERTGAGMMECKKALTETAGDMEAAVEALRKKGAATADKKAGRIAAEGTIAVAVDGDAVKGAMVEVNCETDFVAKDGNFTGYADAVARTVLEHDPDSVESLAGCRIARGDGTVDELRTTLIAKIGENITVRRFEVVAAGEGESVASYVHGGKIGVLVVFDGPEETGRDIAMHVAAINPMCVSADEIPEEVLEKERQIFSAQAAETGKPPEIIEKMVKGRINKFVKEITLLDQPFVKDPDQTVKQYLDGQGASVRSFSRLVVGEGIDKRTDDFVAEVMSAAKGN